MCHNGGPADVCVPGLERYLNGEERDRMEKFIQRVKRAGFVPPDGPTADSIASEADDMLFRAIISDPKHVLRRLWSIRQESRYNVPHPFALPAKDNKNFLSRMMFKNIY